jgi:uncharacterized protein (DUF302 family)
MKSIIASLALVSLAACAHAKSPGGDAPVGLAGAGLVTVASGYPVDETVSRLEAALAARGVTVMAKIDHAANAEKAGLVLPASTLLIFGNPAAGTQLMTASQTAGIDLPLKALVYDLSGQTMLSYNDIDFIAGRHGVSADLPVLAAMNGLLSAVAAEATGE